MSAFIYISAVATIEILYYLYKRTRSITSTTNCINNLSQIDKLDNYVSAFIDKNNLDIKHFSFTVLDCAYNVYTNINCNGKFAVEIQSNICEFNKLMEVIKSCSHIICLEFDINDITTSEQTIIIPDNIKILKIHSCHCIGKINIASNNINILIINSRNINRIKNIHTLSTINYLRLTGCPALTYPDNYKYMQLNFKLPKNLKYLYTTNYNILKNKYINKNIKLENYNNYIKYIPLKYFKHFKSCKRSSIIYLNSY